MFKKLISVTFIVISFILSLSACSSDPGNASSTTDQTMNLAGTWKTAENTDQSFRMSAVIVDDTIEITWSSEDTSALYWRGTFTKLKALNGERIISTGDKAAMDASLLGSQESTKTFTYEDGKLSFDLTVVGVTRTVYLEK